MPERGVDSPKDMNERAMRAYRRRRRRFAMSLPARLAASAADDPRRQRVVLDTAVTVLSPDTLAAISAEDAAEARRVAFDD